MIEVQENLFVGDQQDYESQIHNEEKGAWKVVQACKEPYHRQALGYSGRGAPKRHPEYLIARRGNRLILNLIDADSPAYIPKEIIDEALVFIDEHLSDKQKVLVHCNQGMSRSAGIAMLYLGQQNLIDSQSFAEARKEFKKIYPPCNLSKGMSGFLKQHWDEYVN